MDRYAMPYSDSHETVRREVITVQIPDHRRAQHQQASGHQRFSPHDNRQGSVRYQTSPVLAAATTEDYDAATIVTQPGSTGVHLGSPAPPYSPPMDSIRPGQQQPQHLVPTSYADAAGVVKYDPPETAAAADTIKASNTYTNLETVAIPPSQTVQYTQYLASETFQQASTYSYAKPGEPVILAYPSTQLSSRVTEVRRARDGG